MKLTDGELERLTGGKLLLGGTVLVARVIANDVIVGMVRVHWGRRDVKAPAPDINLNWAFDFGPKLVITIQYYLGYEVQIIIFF